MTDLQLDALRQAGCEKIFEECGSGASVNRPVLADALSRLRSGDTLIVWKLDQLGRTIRKPVELVDDLGQAKVNFRSVTDGIDTATPAGRMIFRIMAALAEMERDLIRERVNAGLAAAKARGCEGGRRPIMPQAQIELGRRLLAEGGSIRGVAEGLGVNPTTRYRSLGLGNGRRG